jgi:APA family basic amino acid/polyamine antiporter
VPFGPFLLPALGVASCLFLMYFLPPASWWRFIGWLVLGFAIYSAYGYSRSAIGRRMGRPGRASGPLKTASLGFLLTAIGLFTIPHNAGLGRLLSEAADAAAADHGRALAGLTLIGVGLILGIAGLALERGAQRNSAA